MKKFIIASVVVLSTVAFTSCKKENVAPAPTAKLNTVSDKANLGNADFTGDQTGTAVDDKANLGNADYTTPTI